MQKGSLHNEDAISFDRHACGNSMRYNIIDRTLLLMSIDRRTNVACFFWTNRRAPTSIVGMVLAEYEGPPDSTVYGVRGNGGAVVCRKVLTTGGTRGVRRSPCVVRSEPW